MLEELLDRPELPDSEKEVQRLADESAILLIAASETPAKVLAVIIFHLLDNPTKMQRLRAELDGANHSQMKGQTLTRLERLPYMSAVIKEGLRLHNGITARTQRVAPSVQSMEYRCRDTLEHYVLLHPLQS